MKDEENNTAKEETAKKMKEASDLTDEETATKTTEGEANDDEEEEEETTKKMEEGSDLLEEETTTKEKGEANDPTEEDSATKKTNEEENDPKEEETAKKMEEERNPEKKMEAEGEPPMVNAIWRKEKMKRKIVQDEWEIPRIHDLCKFEHVQVGSSSRHHPFSDEVIQEHRPVDTAKLLAVRNALLWAEDGGRVHHNYPVELESDQVVQHLRDFASVYWLLPDDLRDLMDECLTLRMHFRRMQFASISAGENRVAHCLATQALHHGCEGEWLAFDAPDWLQEEILEDLPN